jgi:hypothetical protein
MSLVDSKSAQLAAKPKECDAVASTQASSAEAEAWYVLQGTKGIHLRQLLRELCNFFRSVQRELLLHAADLADASPPVNMNDAIHDEPGTSCTQPKLWPPDFSHQIQVFKNRHKRPCHAGVHTAERRHCQSVHWEVPGSSTGVLLVRSASGKRVLYETATSDLAQLQVELLRVGTHYLSGEDAAAAYTADACASLRLLVRLYECEVCFQLGKQQLVHALLMLLQHTNTARERLAGIAQLVVNVTARRPRLALNQPSFERSYASRRAVAYDMNMNMNMIVNVHGHAVACVDALARAVVRRTPVIVPSAGFCACGQFCSRGYVEWSCALVAC